MQNFFQGYSLPSCNCCTWLKASSMRESACIPAVKISAEAQKKASSCPKRSSLPADVQLQYCAAPLPCAGQMNGSFRQSLQKSHQSRPEQPLKCPSRDSQLQQFWERALPVCLMQPVNTPSFVSRTIFTFITRTLQRQQRRTERAERPRRKFSPRTLDESNARADILDFNRW